MGVVIKELGEGGHTAIILTCTRLVFHKILEASEEKGWADTRD